MRKYFPFGKYDRLYAVRLQCFIVVTLILKIFNFWHLSLADIIGDYFAKLASFQLILFLDYALGLECYVTNVDSETVLSALLIRL